MWLRLCMCVGLFCFCYAKKIAYAYLLFVTLLSCIYFVLFFCTYFSYQTTPRTDRFNQYVDNSGQWSVADLSDTKQQHPDVILTWIFWIYVSW